MLLPHGTAGGGPRTPPNPDRHSPREVPWGSTVPVRQDSGGGSVPGEASPAPGAPGVPTPHHQARGALWDPSSQPSTCLPCPCPNAATRLGKGCPGRGTQAGPAAPSPPGGEERAPRAQPGPALAPPSSSWHRRCRTQAVPGPVSGHGTWQSRALRPIPAQPPSGLPGGNGGHTATRGYQGCPGQAPPPQPGLGPPRLGVQRGRGPGRCPSRFRRCRQTTLGGSRSPSLGPPLLPPGVPPPPGASLQLTAARPRHLTAQQHPRGEHPLGQLLCTCCSPHWPLFPQEHPHSTAHPGPGTSVGFLHARLPRAQHSTGRAPRPRRLSKPGPEAPRGQLGPKTCRPHQGGTCKRDPGPQAGPESARLRSGLKPPACCP